jgi:GT2 family glycosyltransferase
MTVAFPHAETVESGAELRRLHAELAEAQIHILALKERLRIRDEQYERIIRSWSWRLTAPARAFAELLGLARRSLGRWRRAWAVLTAEGPRVMAIKAGVELVAGACQVLGRPTPFCTRYLSKPVANGQADPFVFVLASPRPEITPLVRGEQVVYGCAAAPAGIEQIEVEVDGVRAGVAEHGLSCDGLDLAIDLPAAADLPQAGFRFVWNTRTLRKGRHRLAVRARTHDGLEKTAFCTLYVVGADDQRAGYRQWIERVESPDIAQARREAPVLSPRPLLSVVMPVFNTRPALLRGAIESLRLQVYDRWELCLGDDGSTDPATLQVLNEALADPRIKVRRLPENRGIAAASNAALSLACGVFVVLLDQDDLLAPHALYEVARAAADPQVTMIYSDEDKLDAAGVRYDPFFKPDWSPDLLLSCNYLNHLTAIRTGVLRSLGGFSPSYDFSQDYDLYLRVAEQPGRIVHVPKVLYHWRAVEGSSALVAGLKTASHSAAQRALEAAARRRGLEATVEPGPGPGTWRVRYRLRQRPLVSVLLPCGGKVNLLRQCIDGLRDKTSYEPIEVVLIDNSHGGEVKAFYDLVLSRRLGRTRYLDCRGLPFNYSMLNNWGAKAASGEMLLLLNDDVVPINHDWLEAMLEHAQRPEVGAVGAKLLYPNGLIQHAGVVMGIFESSGHAFKMVPGDESLGWRYFGLPHLVRNTSAVTAACLLLRKEVFWEAGGFDEEHLPIAFQDVDLCLEILARGYRNVYTPYAKLYHYESVTKSEKTPNRAEVEHLISKWSALIACDPYYSPHLTRRTEDYAIRTE